MSTIKDDLQKERKKIMAQIEKQKTVRTRAENSIRRLLTKLENLEFKENEILSQLEIFEGKKENQFISKNSKKSKEDDFYNQGEKRRAEREKRENEKAEKLVKTLENPEELEKEVSTHCEVHKVNKPDVDKIKFW